MRLAWAVSGKGIAARAIREAHLAGLLASKLDMVIFDRTGATDPMAAYCSRSQIDYRVIAPDHLENEFLDIQRSGLFDCMGLTFNRLIPGSVINAFNGCIFNLHFSLLPAFPGFGAVRKALDSNLLSTGVTVHFIDAGTDSGPIIAQAKVPIKACDDEITLGRRLFEASIPLLLQTVRMMESNRALPFEVADADLVQFAAKYCLAN